MHILNVLHVEKQLSGSILINLKGSRNISFKMYNIAACVDIVYFKE